MNTYLVTFWLRYGSAQLMAETTRAKTKRGAKKAIAKEYDTPRDFIFNVYRLHKSEKNAC